MTARPAIRKCRGRNPRTGKPVGERHRWSGGAWGKGSCDFCGKYLEQLLEKPPMTTQPSRNVWPDTVCNSLAETLERARRRNEPLFQLDEIESPDRCVVLRYGTAWVWADFRDGKRREVNANYPRGFDTSTEAFADYAAALQDFGR